MPLFDYVPYSGFTDTPDKEEVMSMIPQAYPLYAVRRAQGANETPYRVVAWEDGGDGELFPVIVANGGVAHVTGDALDYFDSKSQADGRAQDNRLNRQDKEVEDRRYREAGA